RVEEAAEVKIELAIAVVIEKAAACDHAGLANAGAGGDIGEGAVAIVLEQVAVLVKRGAKEIGIAVVIEVGETSDIDVAQMAQARMLGDVFERAVSFVGIEGELAAGTEENVVMAVAVDVGGGAAGVGVPHRLELELDCVRAAVAGARQQPLVWFHDEM